MKASNAGNVAELLTAARLIANLAYAEGVSAVGAFRRAKSDHLGAILADAVLQAGLNYATVVRPRVERIVREYPEASDMKVLMTIVSDGSVSQFLNWKHPVKSSRFEHIVMLLHDHGISKAGCLREKLLEEPFRQHLKAINGIGPKTIDYMACLTGIDSIAVDRHIRSFAKKAGIIDDEYEYLKSAFCYAADLLLVPRREFDAWIWRSYSRSTNRQIAFAF